MTLLFASGFVIGILSSALGIGGGLFTVPLLIYIGKNDGFPSDFLAHMAVSSSLVSAFVLSLTAGINYFRLRQIEFRPAYFILAGNISGAAAGSVLGSHLKSFYLVLFFVIFIGLNGIYSLTKYINNKSNISSGRKLLSVDSRYYFPVSIVSGFFIGFVSSIVGIGGGLFMVPFFLYVYGMKIHKAVATSGFCIIFTSLSGAAGYSLFASADLSGYSSLSLGFLYLPYLLPLAAGNAIGGLAGSQIAVKAKSSYLHVTYGLLQLSVSVKMFVDIII